MGRLKIKRTAYDRNNLPASCSISSSTPRFALQRRSEEAEGCELELVTVDHCKELWAIRLPKPRLWLKLSKGAAGSRAACCYGVSMAGSA